MSLKNDKDYLYLIWKQPDTRKQYIVGELSKNGGYCFKYSQEIEEAIKNGFEPLISFEDKNKIYKNNILFPVFASRLPDEKRQDIDVILKKYGLEKYDAYNLLKRSEARLPIDNLGFIDPILEFDGEVEIKRYFHLSGVRHYIGCEGNLCDNSFELVKGEEVELVLEPDNKNDKNAIKVLDKAKNMIGYIPRYYSPKLTEIIGSGNTVECKINEYMKNKNCNECIKVELTIRPQ